MFQRKWLMILAAGIGTLAASSCNGDGIAGPTDLVRLSQATARWEARPFADYSYEIRTDCFCPPEINRWTRVSVRGGVVVDADPVDPDPSYPITNLQYWHPIDSIFARLSRAMTGDDAYSYLDAIVVSYHPTLGYPTSIEYRAKPTIADGGSTLTLRDVRALE